MSEDFAPSRAATELAAGTLFSQLHVLEFWMPQYAGKRNCNLSCVHCYVPPGGQTRVMNDDEYEAVLLHIMRDVKPYGGKWDVVFPGMEPLLPRNIPLLFRLTNRAAKEGARSIGLTTNGVLLVGKTLERVTDSPITTINVSIDGVSKDHDAQRGKRGLFAKTTRNIKELCRRAPEKRVITNTTITRLNEARVAELVAVADALGCTYAAFHPFEIACNADNSLALDSTETSNAILRILESFATGQGSVVIEFESSTAGAFFPLWESGAFAEMELVADETGFLFLRRRKGIYELLVSLMFHPHHFIRTLRVLSDGSLSSCRRMALCGWTGIGDLRTQSLGEIADFPETTEALAHIWQEFLSQTINTRLNNFLRFIETSSRRR